MEDRRTVFSVIRASSFSEKQLGSFLAEEIVDRSMIGKLSLRDDAFKTVGHSEDTSTR